MLQIFIVILFRISSKIVSLFLLLCPKSTDYFHNSQVYCRILQPFHLYNQKLQQYFVAHIIYTIE